MLEASSLAPRTSLDAATKSLAELYVGGVVLGRRLVRRTEVAESVIPYRTELSASPDA